MIVCICRRVSDKTIRAAIAEGASSVDEVGAACRAGTGCGCCHEAIEEMLAERSACEHGGECLDCRRARRAIVSPYLQLA